MKPVITTLSLAALLSTSAQAHTSHAHGFDHLIEHLWLALPVLLLAVFVLRRKKTSTIKDKQVSTEHRLSR